MYSILVVLTIELIFLIVLFFLVANLLNEISGRKMKKRINNGIAAKTLFKASEESKHV